MRDGTPSSPQPKMPTFDLHSELERINKAKLDSYGADPGLLKEQLGIEETVLAGGYGYRQILELVQNGADALLEAQESGKAIDGDGRIHVQLRGTRLYVANTGAPLSPQGLDALLRSHSSPKRGNQIGRFGLGFKSLLRLEGQIDVFTRASGSFRFDPERCRKELCQRFSVTEAPGLRLAWPLRSDERSSDPLCAALDWAETIVRVEIGATILVEQIRQEIGSFPSEFLLFLPIPITLTLDVEGEQAREVRVIIEGAERILRDGETTSRWRMATREVTITDERAKGDATHIHSRESVPVSWAMPLGGREESGRFWAFFPTHTPTHIPGILNAPWKLNSDRNAIIGGEWNDALMTEAASLIAETLPNFATPDDPGRPLDTFPRQLDRKDEVAAALVEEVWARLKNAEVIPDGTGAPRRAQDLWRYPYDHRQLATEWHNLADVEKQRQMVHPSCLDSQRASRLEALAKRIDVPSNNQILPALRRSPVDSWFRMVASNEVGAALRVLRLAKSFSREERSGEWSQTRSTLPIVPTRSGQLVEACRAVLAPDGVSVPGREAIATELLSNDEARCLMKEVLGVPEPDDQLWQRILEEALPKPSNGKKLGAAEAWREFWDKLRRAPDAVRKNFVEQRKGEIRVRRRDGKWSFAWCVLLPGDIVPENDPSNQGVLIDAEVHGNDQAILELMGVTPDMNGKDELPAVASRQIFKGWLDGCRNQWFKEAFTGGSKPQNGYLWPLVGTVPWGLNLLQVLKGTARARLTLALCGRLQNGSMRVVKFGHSSREGAYSKIDAVHPLPWLLIRYGELWSSDSGSAPLKAIVARHEEGVLQKLPMWREVDAALHLLTDLLTDLTVTEPDLHRLWKAAIAELATPESIGNDELKDLWFAAAKDGFVPTELPSSSGPLPLKEVFVTTSSDLAQRARTLGYFVVVLDTSTQQLWVKAGAQDLANLFQPKWEPVDGLRERLADVVPELWDVLREYAREAARCERVTQLRLTIAETTQPVPCLIWDDALLLDTEQMETLSRAERMARLLDGIASSNWLDGSVEKARRRLADAGVDARHANVAQGATLAARLLLAVGSRVEPLLDALGAPLRDMELVRQCAPEQLSELVLAQLGPSALSRLQNALQDEGLQPPARWGTAAARAFVEAIGFPPEFASSAEARREPEELIHGPIELPPLHDFQEEVFDGLERLLNSGTGRRRAIVSLPTGGGKTRVTVEAAVKLVLKPESDRRSVLWIAQTDELCEQAVEAFRQVWVNLGAQRTNLRLMRLWGGNANPSPLQPGKPVVVVASIQTLNNRIGVGMHGLAEHGLVVVDECHHAITPSYTRLLRWLDAETPGPGSVQRNQPAIVGLSATPFRSDNDESRNLARRFDGCWLPSDQARLYTRLRADGVLARAYYEELDSGVKLTDDELARLEHGRWEGLDFENWLETFNQRLASDTRRNERLVECIKTASEHSILFFTNSVAHADEMAARLNLAGIGAAAISGNTPSAARRYFLDQFQSGQIRVLCNHSVLTTGFDAPRTDMVLIARQVFSAVRYMQMVGRGLRGVKNGGTESCRIVTVMDNLDRFEDRLPYHYCRNLYQEGH